MLASFVDPVLESIQVPQIVQGPGHVRQACAWVLLRQWLAQFQSSLEVPAGFVHPVLLCTNILQVKLRQLRLGVHERNPQGVMRHRTFRDLQRVQPQVVIAIPITHLVKGGEGERGQHTQCRNDAPNRADSPRIR